jgi:hypothetical protein
MQGNQSTLLELGSADHQPVRRYVIVSQPDGLGDAKSRTGQQREERAVSLPAQGAVPRLRGQLDDPPNLLVGENVRSRAEPTLAAEYRGRYLMTLVFCPEIVSEAGNVSQSPGPLPYRR